MLRVTIWDGVCIWPFLRGGARACRRYFPRSGGGQPEVIRRASASTTPYECQHYHPPTHPHKVFAGRLNARGTRTCLPRRAGGAWPACRRRRRHGARPWCGGDAARAPPSYQEPPYRRSARAWRWQQGPRGVPPNPRPRQELEAHLAPSLSSSAQRCSARRLRHPHSPPGRQETTCALTRGAHVGARAHSAPAFGAERVARGSDPAATGRRAPGRAAPTPSAPSA